MPSVIVGSALDIVQRCRVPRFLFVDFPLGNPCGKPWDTSMQQRIVETTEYSDERWGSDDWKGAYMEVNDQNRSALQKMGEALRADRKVREPRTFD